MSTRTLADVIVNGAVEVLYHGRVHAYCPGASNLPAEDWHIYLSSNGRLFVTIDTPTHAVIATFEVEGEG